MTHVWIITEEDSEPETVLAQAATSMEGAKWILLQHLQFVVDMANTSEITLESELQFVQVGQVDVVDPDEAFVCYYEGACYTIHRLEVVG